MIENNERPARGRRIPVTDLWIGDDILQASKSKDGKIRYGTIRVKSVDGCTQLGFVHVNKTLCYDMASYVVIDNR